MMMHITRLSTEGLSSMVSDLIARLFDLSKKEPENCEYFSNNIHLFCLFLHEDRAMKWGFH